MLESHSEYIGAVAFALDGQLVAAAVAVLCSSAGPVDIAQPVTIPMASTRISFRLDRSTEGHSLSRAYSWPFSSALVDLAPCTDEILSNG